MKKMLHNVLLIASIMLTTIAPVSAARYLENGFGSAEGAVPPPANSWSWEDDSEMPTPIDWIDTSWDDDWLDDKEVWANDYWGEDEDGRYEVDCSHDYEYSVINGSGIWVDNGNTHTRVGLSYSSVCSECDEPGPDLFVEDSTTGNHSFFGGVCWVCGASEPSTCTKMVVTLSNSSSTLRIRSGAGTSYAVLGRLYNGNEVQVTAIENGWAQIVTLEGISGFVSSQYLSSTDSSTSSSTGSTAMSSALYGTSDGYLSCGFDGYTTTSGRHEGIDFVRSYGSAIYSLTDGVITRITEGCNGSSGLSTIAIYCSSADQTVIYLHADPIDSLYVGQSISCGQQIATEAWRGVSSASGTHTHVEVRDGRRTSAAKSVGDNTLDNVDPGKFWNTQGYLVK